MPNAKHLRPGWKNLRFDQIAQLITERVEPTPEDSAQYVGLEHLDPGSLKIRRWGSQTDLIGTKFKMSKGDILFARRNAYLKRVAIAPHDGLFSAHGMVLRPRPEAVLPEFLPFFMQSDLFMDRAIEISVGSLSPTINWKTMAAQEFALPPIEEQKRRVRMLAAAMEVDNEAHLVSEAGTRLLASIRRTVFERNGGRTRLSALAQTITSGSRGWATHYSTDGEPFLRVGNLSHESIELNLSDLQRVRPPDDLEAKRTQVRTGDVLLGITGEAGVGRVGLVRDGREASYVSQHIALIRLDRTKADPEFIAHMLAGHDGQRQIFRSNQAGAKAGLTLKAVENLSTPSLALKEQKRIAETLTSIQRAVLEARMRGASAWFLSRMAWQP